jgi:hypothetical protein
MAAVKRRSAAEERTANSEGSRYALWGREGKMWMKRKTMKVSRRS